jgi:hypothetical protein
MRACGPVPNWQSFASVMRALIFEDNGGGPERAE